MGFRKKLVGTTLAVGLVTGGGGCYLYETNELPGLYAIEPPVELPKKSGEGLICAADIQKCTRENALGVLATSTKIDVGLENISKHVQHAIIAAEDRRFEENNGCDAIAIMAAIKSNGWNKVKRMLRLTDKAKPVRGGSTIPRQVAGVIYPKATEEELRLGQPAVQAAYEIDKKINKGNDDKWIETGLAQQAYECSLALGMKEKYSDEEILEKYLNNVYFGRGATGIEAAAQAYFGKSAKDLNLQESIILASVLPSPSNMDLDGLSMKDPSQRTRLKQEAEVLRRNYNRVVQAMFEVGHLNEAQKAKLLDAEIELKPFRPKPLNNMRNADKIGARHAVELVKKQAAALLNIPVTDLAKGYVIRMTLNTKDQATMYKVIRNEPHLKRKDVNGAGVALRKDGGVTAMVGSEDFDKLQVNMAVGKAGGGSGRDSGSSNKGFAFALALEKG